MSRRGRTVRARRGSASRRRLARLALSALAMVTLAAVGLGAGYLGVKLRGAMQRGDIFDIRGVEVIGADLVSEEEILIYSGLEVGDGLYAFEAGLIERSVAEHPMVERARVVRRPPHQLRILIAEQRPVAYVALGALYAVDKSGQIFARAEALGGIDLPVVTGLDPATAADDAQDVAKELRLALQILRAYDRVGLNADEIAEIFVDPDLGVELVLAAEVQAVHLGRGRFVEKLTRLTQLRRALRQRGERASHVFLSDGPDPRRVVVRLVENRPAASGEINAAPVRDNPPT